ncbi:hypothetical protein DFJ73DRAFT_756275 [Zopfochytrium polystomum]|nr:hypothetical protein DFJ73DRAFT_756275 [Zopfochytrium polystomum]
MGTVVLSMAELSTVTASSTNVQNECYPNLCNPANVLNAQTTDGFSLSDASRWMSNPGRSYVNGTSCNTEWLNFRFPESHTVELNTASIEYGDYSWTFDNKMLICPQVSVAYETDGPYTSLVPGTDYRCSITPRINHQNVTADRVDQFEFEDSVRSISGVKELRFVWNSIMPQGNYKPYVCAIDVFEVFISAYEPASSSSTGGSGTAVASSSDTPRSSLSTGAAVGIALLVLVVAAVVALLLVRRHNINRRKQAALAMRIQASRSF